MKPPVVEILTQLADRRCATADVWLSAFGAAQPTERTQILNALALAAPTDPQALDVLLTLIDAQRLAIPAIRRVLIDQDDIDDAHQDVLIQVARSVGGFDQRARFSTWLHSLARNVAIAQIRRRRPTVSLHHDNAHANPLPHNDSVSYRISSMVSARTEVRAAVLALPEPYATSVRLRDIDQLTYREIADTEGIEINTVKSRIARGRALLATHIGDLGDVDA